jgi:hypothetical protein
MYDIVQVCFANSARAIICKNGLASIVDLSNWTAGM